jgi:sterol desaturase/sphingolipid hydroxylase (fatty acid hydroxylase superfamily)/uncharacterized protein (DUF2147 family)
MEHVSATADWLFTFLGPWPSIFAFDLGRYLLVATVISMVILLVPSRVAAFSRTRPRFPKPNQAWHELRHSVVAASIFALVGLCVYHGVALGIFRVYAHVADHGWLYWVGSIVLIVVAHDTYFYWTHRWIHTPGLFSRVHRTHHQSVAPTVWTSYSFSVSEAMLQAGFLPLFLLLVPVHEAVLFIWMAHQILRNVAGHSGVELEPRAWLASWWGQWFTTTLHHDMHHQHGRYNYGLYFAWWDRWSGTEHPEYRARLASLVASLDAMQPTIGTPDKHGRSAGRATIAVFVAALVSIAISHRSHASELLGEWATQGNAAHVRIERCESSPSTLCGIITWLWEPVDAKGEPIRDERNPDPSLRSRSLVGASLLKDFRPAANGELTEGQIYNPENGRTYRASMKLRGEDILEVKGCFLIVCDTQVWRRADSVCKAVPQAQD